MSPTSTESGYRRGIAVTLAALLVLCAGLFALGATQGPKLSSVQLDVDRLSSQQVRLVSNQPIAEIAPSQVRISPETPFTVSTSGTVIAVVFTAALDYGTQYTVAVSGVRSPVRDIESSFETSFSTGDATVYYLDRSGDTDRIYVSGIGTTARDVVYESDTITEFARVGAVLAVVTRDANRIDSLNLVQLATSRTETISLPDDGWVTAVRGSDSAKTLGFVFTSVGDADFSRTLFTIDLTATRELRPTTDLGGESLHVLDWQFRHVGESLLALDSSGALAVIDPNEPSEYLPLGDYRTLSHISEDGLTATVSDQLGFLTLSIDGLVAERFAPAPVAGSEPYVGEAQVVGDALVQHVYSYYVEENRFDSYLAVDDGTVAQVLFGTKGGTATVMSFTVSPNEQFVAIEVDPGSPGGEDDGYIGSSRPTDVTTYVVEISTGEVAASFSGFDFAW